MIYIFFAIWVALAGATLFARDKRYVKALCGVYILSHVGFAATLFAGGWWGATSGTLFTFDEAGVLFYLLMAVVAIYVLIHSEEYLGEDSIVASPYLSEQSHSVAEVLKRRIVKFIIALHLPGVLVDVGYSMTLTVKHTLKRLEVARDVIRSAGVLFERFFAVVITYRIENVGVAVCVRVSVALSSSEVDIRGELYRLTDKRVFLYLRLAPYSHSSYDLR